MARLTIPDEQTFATFTVVTSTTVFPITFSLFAKADLTVLVDGVALDQSAFTFTGTLLEGGGYDGGTVTLNTAVDDVTVRIERNVAPTRASNFAPASSVPVQSVDQALNRQMAISQDHVRRIGVAETTLEGVAGNVAAVAADRAAIEAIFDVAGEVQSGASVTFLAAGTGAVVRDLQARARDTVSAFDYIPVAEHAAIVAGTSTYNASAAVQAAIDTGKTVEFPAGFYQVVGLTMSTNGQRLVALGYVNLQKRANGVILTASANNIELNGITFRGDSGTPTFTGDNVVLTGASPRVINCGSMWAYGRALKATGDNAVVQGSNPIWQTTDATGTGYDIELGVSGTATLYQQLEGIYTSQVTGGILTTDTGSVMIRGGQFGKLNIAAGTSPAGVNGGTVIGARILGTVTVGLSNAVFTGNQFSGITMTLAAGTSGCTYVGNLESSGFSLVNSGTANQFILRHDTAGTGGYITYQYGPSNSLGKMMVDPSNGDQRFLNGHIELDADKALRFNTNNKRIGSSSTNLQLVNDDGAIQLAAASIVQHIVGGNVIGFTDANGIALESGKALYNNAIKVVGAQGAAVADATGGVVIDAEARTALNALLARLRTHGLIAT
jgi:hypothetical protein